MYNPDNSRYEKMIYNRCGKSGLKLPKVSLGFWHNFGSKDVFDNMVAMCRTAFDNGITYFDLANNYGPVPGSAEENLGKILKQDFSSHRDELVISSKAGYDMWPGPYGDWGSKKYLIASCDQSLKRTGLEYFDIFYHHRFDPETPLEETMEALNHIVKSGKALYAGISNYNKEQTEEAQKILKSMNCPFIINQRSYSILNRAIEEDGLKDFAGKNGIGIIAFCPLSQGLLTNKYLNGIPENSRVKTSGVFLKESDITPTLQNKLKALNEVAASRGESLAQMSLAWVLRDSDVTSVLIGASRPEQIVENCKIVDAKPFTSEELSKIDQICKG